MDGTVNRQIRSYAGAVGHDLHIDTPLSNLTTGYRPQNLIAPDIYPVVPVTKQSDVYYTWTKNVWFRIPNAQRARGTRAARVNFDVSSNNYYAKNYALAMELPYEDTANADAALNLRGSAANFIVDQLSLAWEDRLAVTLTTTTNMTSSTALTNAWNDPINGQPIEDIRIGKEAIRLVTGYDPNVIIFSGYAWSRFSVHPDVVDFVRGKGDNTGGGFINQDQAGNALGIGKVLVGKGIKNTGDEDAPGIFIDVWSTACILLYVAPAPGLMVPSHGYTFRWTPAGFPAPFTVERRNDEDIKAEVVEVHHFQDEKVTGSDLGYLIVGT